jgi:homoserine O-acetyltransferase
MRKKKGLVISFTSDWLYPTQQSHDIVRFFSGLNASVSFAEIGTDHGHDAFLTDIEGQTLIIRSFLDALIP